MPTRDLFLHRTDSDAEAFGHFQARQTLQHDQPHDLPAAKG